MARTKVTQKVSNTGKHQSKGQKIPGHGQQRVPTSSKKSSKLSSTKKGLRSQSKIKNIKLSHAPRLIGYGKYKRDGLIQLFRDLFNEEMSHYCPPLRIRLPTIAWIKLIDLMEASILPVIESAANIALVSRRHLNVEPKDVMVSWTNWRKQHHSIWTETFNQKITTICKDWIIDQPATAGVAQLAIKKDDIIHKNDNQDILKRKRKAIAQTMATERQRLRHASNNDREEIYITSTIAIKKKLDDAIKKDDKLLIKKYLHQLQMAQKSHMMSTFFNVQLQPSHAHLRRFQSRNKDNDGINDVFKYDGEDELKVSKQEYIKNYLTEFAKPKKSKKQIPETTENEDNNNSKENDDVEQLINERVKKRKSLRNQN